MLSSTRLGRLKGMARVWVVPLVFAIAGCGDTRESATSMSGHAGEGGLGVGGLGVGGMGTGALGGGGNAGAASVGGAGGDGVGGQTATPTFEVITDRHRYDPGKMFGGWGPHLGHLMRAQASDVSGSTLWWVDDHCAQAPGPGAVCDVNDNHSLGYFELSANGWSERAVIALPGTIQQNTATIVDPASGELQTFGIDSGASALYMCRYHPTAGGLGCQGLPFTLVASSNYVGAAVSPAGHKLVWWTGVVDGGGGTFHYIVDYGGGWNGPRSGGAGGYNDASYIHVAFGGATANDFTMHGQLVAGQSPNWTFLGAVGYGDLGTTLPVSWSLALSPPEGTAVISTNDIWTDPASGDTHLVARLESGAAAYYHRPPGGSWSNVSFELAATYRARFVFSEDHLVLVYGPNAGGIAYRSAGPLARVAGLPIDWGALTEHTVEVLPPGFGQLYAIYPESPMYQHEAAEGVHVAVVGSAEQHVAAHVVLQP